MTATSFEEKVYATDISDEQWEVIGLQLPLSPPVGTDRTVDMRKVVNGIFYLNRMGCQWRMLPKEYEHWNTQSSVIAIAGARMGRGISFTKPCGFRFV